MAYATTIPRAHKLQNLRAQRGHDVDAQNQESYRDSAKYPLNPNPFKGSLGARLNKDSTLDFVAYSSGFGFRVVTYASRSMWSLQVFGRGVRAQKVHSIHVFEMN